MFYEYNVPRDRQHRFNIILDILESYWFDEPDELKVRVTMDFVHANGEKQTKQITWINPAYCQEGDHGDGIVRLCDMTEEYFENEEREFWSVKDWKKRS